MTAKQAQAKQNPQPSPEEQKMKAEQEAMQAKIAADAKAKEAEIGLKQKETEATIALEQKKFEAEHALKRESLNFERNVKHNESMAKAMETGMPMPAAPLPPGTTPEPGPFDVLSQVDRQADATHDADGASAAADEPGDGCPASEAHRDRHGAQRDRAR